ncbi:unnamed protein product, partial [Coregonus sp. 'balchen']
GPTVSPTVSLLPPSSEQLSGGSATLACLLTGYSPQGALVSWEVDGLEVSKGVVTSPEEEKEGLYRRSSTLTLSKAGWEQGELYTCRVSHFQHTQASPLRRSQLFDQWTKAGSVTCEATLKDQTPVTHTLEPHHCSQ